MSDIVFGAAMVLLIFGSIVFIRAVIYFITLPEKTEEQLAHDALENDGVKVTRGGIIMVPMSRVLKIETWDAIRYLCDEWDYGYQWYED